MAYFDANATTPLCPSAAAVLAEAQRDFWYNPSSPYPPAAAVHNRLEAARACLARMLGCESEQVVFNSGASEGAHSLFQYLADVLGQSATVAVSAIEHPCVRESARRFFPGRVTEIPVGADGVADMAALEAIASGRDGDRPGLIALMAANNETGAIQPWQQALDIARSHGIPFYTDAAQWLGKEPAAGLGAADFVTGCAHKFGGGKGVGFLKIGGDFTGFYSQTGGAQENGHRAGTENFPAIAAMLAALESHEAALGKYEAALGEQQAARGEHEAAHKTQQTAHGGRQAALARDAFEATLTEAIPGIVVHSDAAPRLANTSSLLLPRHRNTRWVARLAKRGFYVSTGSACATGKTGPSHVLAAMGLTAQQAERTVRVSALWADATPTQWQALAAAFIEVWHELNAEDGGEGSLARVISF